MLRTNSEGCVRDEIGGGGGKMWKGGGGRRTGEGGGRRTDDVFRGGWRKMKEDVSRGEGGTMRMKEDEDTEEGGG